MAMVSSQLRSRFCCELKKIVIPPSAQRPKVPPKNEPMNAGTFIRRYESQLRMNVSAAATKKAIAATVGLEKVDLESDVSPIGWWA